MQNLDAEKDELSMKLKDAEPGDYIRPTPDLLMKVENGVNGAMEPILIVSENDVNLFYYRKRAPLKS